MGDAQERLRQLQQSLNNARQSGFKGFGGGGGNPRNVLGGIGSLLLVGGGGALLYNSLFNGLSRWLHLFHSSQLTSTVDGGHRAIKYTRISGVKSDIYNEGKREEICYRLHDGNAHQFVSRNTSNVTLVRNADHV